ncbi:hypothetical protein G7046_g841 [Stylonectria norvegica]|nr:hypothetical protein G7046_g841 [Stylonectria norvegica]
MHREPSPQTVDMNRTDPEKDETPPVGLTIPAEASSDESNETGSPPKSKRSIAGFRWFLVCIAIFSANFLYGLDTTIAADLQGAVSESFDNVSQLGWLGIGFCLGSTVSILPLGKAYGIFDTKWLFIGCLVMFAAGSALCGAAPSMSALIVGRVWAGTGGAGMYLGTLNLVSNITTPREASLYIAFQGFIVLQLGDGLSTSISLFLLQQLRYISSLSPLCRNSPTRRFLEKMRKLDWLGIVLTCGLYVCIVLAFTFGGPIWAWSDGRFIALVVLFVVFTAALAVTQQFAVLTTKTDRLFPCDFMGNPQLILLYICMACGGASLFVATYYIPLYFLFVHGDTGTQAAVRLLPFVCFYVTSILFCGWALPRTGYHMAWYLVSGMFLTAGGAAMYTIKADSPASYTYGFSVLLGLGLTYTQAGYSVTSSIVSPDRMSDAIQFMNVAQGQSQMLGLVIASAIFQSKAFEGMKAVLQGQNFSTEEIRAAIAGSQSKVFETISPELRARCTDVIVKTISDIWIMVITAGALLIVCSLFLTKKRF